MCDMAYIYIHISLQIEGGWGLRMYSIGLEGWIRNSFLLGFSIEGFWLQGLKRVQGLI